MSDNIYLNTVPQKKILATLEPGLDLTLISSNVKLYTSNKEGKNWLYSDLEGLLCFILDYNLKTKYLVLYNSFSFEKIFQYELYKDFQKYFKSLQLGQASLLKFLHIFAATDFYKADFVHVGFVVF